MKPHLPDHGCQGRTGLGFRLLVQHQEFESLAALFRDGQAERCEFRLGRAQVLLPELAMAGPGQPAGAVAIPFSGLMNKGMGHGEGIPGEVGPGSGRVLQFSKSQLPRRGDWQVRQEDRLGPARYRLT